MILLHSFWISLAAAFQAALDGGGFVMPPLFGITVLLSWALGVRALTLGLGRHLPAQAILHEQIVQDEVSRADSRFHKRGLLLNAVHQLRQLRELRSSNSERPKVLPHQSINAELAEHHEVLRRHATLIRSLVAMAPLLGLLGTVVGMIETFDSLGDMALFAQSGGIAGGVSQALMTTQVGLAVAIPGLIVGKLLDRKEALLHDALEGITDAYVQSTQHSSTTTHKAAAEYFAAQATTA